MLILGFLVGLVLGVARDYLGHRYGWRLSAVLTALVVVSAMAWFAADQDDVIAIVALTTTFGSTHWVVEPYLKRRARPSGS